MRLNIKATISIRNKMTDSTPLHVATEGGYFDVVKKLLDEGASASDENKVDTYDTLIYFQANIFH